MMLDVTFNFVPKLIEMSVPTFKDKIKGMHIELSLSAKMTCLHLHLPRLTLACLL